MNTYKPEGFRENNAPLKTQYTIEELEIAQREGTILEFKTYKSDEYLNLYININENIVGIIPYGESEMTYDDSAIKSIAVISKVGCIVAAKVTKIEYQDNNKIVVKLSRKAAQIECQENYVANLKPGDIIDIMVRHIEDYGLFCDVGCGINGLLPISNFSITRISNAKYDLKHIKSLKAVVKCKDELGRLQLTHRELLGTWDEETSKFKPEDTVVGIVRAIKPYGTFVELSPNLSGLSDTIPEGVEVGDTVSVFIKSINPEKMKIKVIIISKNNIIDNRVEKIRYKYKNLETPLKYWRYSPEGCTKVIETVFDGN